MKKFIGILCAAALPFVAFGVLSFSVHAQNTAPVPRPTSAPLPITPEDTTPPADMTPSAPEMGDQPADQAPPPHSSSLAPLSDLSDKDQAAPEKTVKTKPAHHRKARHKKKKYAGKFGDRTRIRAAQINLAELGYQPGPSDGVMGKKTKAALKKFQRDHHLRADGILGPVTYDALVREAGSKNPMRSSSAPAPDFYATHPDYYGYFGPDYANPTSFGTPQMIPSRFGTLELDAQQTGQTYRFDMMLNGKSVFHADNQATPVNVSRTFNLNNADAIVLTSYATGDSVCPYRHYLLIVRPNTSDLSPIEECTRDYRAYTENGMLYISFPGPHVDGWSSGTMWRFDNGSLVKL